MGRAPGVGRGGVRGRWKLAESGAAFAMVLLVAITKKEMSHDDVQ
jgi:hypothetical protein